MGYFYAFLGLGAAIFLIGFHFSPWYWCPVCQSWYWLGDQAELLEQPDGNLVLLHGKDSHLHTPGYHGIGGKPVC